MARAIISFFISMPLAVLFNIWFWPGVSFVQVTLLVFEYIVFFLIVYNLLSLLSRPAPDRK